MLARSWESQFCLSDRPSVHAYFLTKPNNAMWIFWYHTKGQSLWFSDTNSDWWATPPSVWNLRSKWPTPFEKRRLRQISTYGISTVRDGVKSLFMTNRKSTRAFKRAIGGVRTLALSPPKGQRVAQTAIFVINFNWIKSATKFHCAKIYRCKIVVYILHVTSTTIPPCDGA